MLCLSGRIDTFQEYNLEISEDIAPLTSILTVHAQDLDTGNYGRLEYEIVGQAANVFEVDPIEGIVKVHCFLLAVDISFTRKQGVLEQVEFPRALSSSCGYDIVRTQPSLLSDQSGPRGKIQLGP